MKRRDFLKGALGAGALAALGPLAKFAEPSKAAPLPPETPVEAPKPFYGKAMPYHAMAVGSGDVSDVYLSSDD